MTSFLVLTRASFRAFNAFVPTLTIVLCLTVAEPNNAQTLEWANHPVPFALPEGSACSAITHDASGNMYATGYFRGTTVDFDPGPGTANLFNSGSLDIFIAKYDAAGNYLWAQKIGGYENDSGSDIALDANGNIYIAGSFNNFVDFDPGPGTAILNDAGNGDIFFAKYDAGGNYLWAKKIGGTGPDYCADLLPDGNGNVFLAGAFQNTADFDPGAGTANLSSTGAYDGFFAKYDPSGNYLWAKQISGTNDASVYSLAVDATGNIYLTGDFFQTADFDPDAGTANLTSAALSDIFIAKYNASGNYLWAKRIGAAGYDTGSKLLLDGNGDMCLLGYFGSAPDFDPGAGTATLTSAGDYDCFFAKYDASGNYIWARGLGGTGRDFGLDFALDANNNFYITGEFRNTVDFDPNAGTVFLTSTGFTDIFIAKYNTSGNYLWATAIGGTEYDAGGCISVSNAGKISVGGKFEDFVSFDFGVNRTAVSPHGDIFITQFTAAFTFEWVNHLVPFQSPGGSVCTGIARDAAGNVYAAGSFSGTTDFGPGPGTANIVGGQDIFIVKYGTSGNYLWAKKIGSTQGTDYATSIALDANGNIFITGVFEQTVDFDPGPGTANLTGVGRGDVFLAKYDPSGNYLWAIRMGDYEIDGGDALALDAGGNVYITGSFVGTVDFDPGAGTANLIAAGNRNIFIAKYSSAGNYIWAKDIGSPSTDEAGDLALDGSGNLYVTGYFQNTADFDPGPGTANLTSFGFGDLFIAKYTTSGNYLWARQMGGTGSENGGSLALDNNGNVCLTGLFSNTADFDPGPGTANLTSQGQWDIALAKYDAAGNYLWAKSMGGTDYDISQDIVLDGNNNIYLTGYFRSTVDFDPGAGVANLTSADQSDIFLASYDASGNYLWAKNIENMGPAGGACLAFGGAAKLNVGGRFTGTADFDFGPGTANRTAVDLSADIFIAQYSVNNAGGGNGQSPVLTCPGNIVRTNDPGQCSAIVQYSTPASDDPQDNVAIVPPSLPGGSAFPIGTNSVTWEATDGGGLTARCTFTVTVSDNQAPHITCPPNQTKSNDPGACGATVSYLTPTASDNCPLPNGQPAWVSGGTMPQANGSNSVSTFPKGITTVVWKATDAAGLTKTCSLRVTVIDTEVPVISCPDNIAVNSAPNSCASAAVTYPAVTATDNCMSPAPTVVQIGGLPGGSNFPGGVNIVTWRATDGSGKTATCSFKVTVTDGQTPNITCPNNMTVTAAPNSCSASTFYAMPSASDNCGIQTMYLEVGMASGSVFPQGTTPVTWRTVDVNGLSKICTFTVTVQCGSNKPANGTEDRTSRGQSNGVSDLLLAPNPATLEVTVSLSGEGTAEESIELMVCDISGRVVWQQQLAAGQRQARLTVETWPSGAYVVVAKGKNLLMTKRLMVE